MASQEEGGASEEYRAENRGGGEKTEADNETDRNVEMWKIKRLIKGLESARG